MLKDFYIFRHGQTNKNLAQVWQGSGLNEGLNANGIKQAGALADKVSQLGIQKLYSSPLVRAVQTATIVAQKIPHVLPLEIMSDLRECYFGKCEGRTFEDVSREFGSFVDAVMYPSFDTWDECFPDGESKKHVFERVEQCLRLIASKEDTVVGIVCHAGVLSALQCGFQLDDVSYDNCSVLHLCYDSETKEFRHVK